MLNDDIIPNIKNILRKYDATNTIQEYFKHVRETDPKKAKYYEDAYTKFKAGGKCKFVLELFCKVDEWFITSKSKKIYEQNNRPRCICNPEMVVKAIGGAINWILMKALKKS